MCFSKSIRGRVELMRSSALQFRGQGACRSSWHWWAQACQQKLAGKCDGQITGVEPAQVTDKLNKQAVSGTEAPLDRSAASCLGRMRVTPLKTFECEQTTDPDRTPACLCGFSASLLCVINF